MAAKTGSAGDASRASRSERLNRPGGRFDERVWALTARIPRGRVTTYGAIARALGRPGAARAVGQALHRNPYAPEVPCHRVVATDGRLTGYAHGLSMKRRLLSDEGVAITGDRVDPAYIQPIE